ncbi:MAG: hypothetical protein M1828_000222 [Chrysothrix sp. TS-e1954]|nr:MAG: hypothetical protein M1828_000222 [Chrysothrix sp. TS-e1954]
MALMTRDPKELEQGMRLRKSYDDAAAACIRHVEAIAAPLRKSNSKFTDPDFDLYDLKVFGLGHATTFRGRKRMKKCSITFARVEAIFEDPVFMVEDTASAVDAHQGPIGNCWFIAALAAASAHGGLIEKLCVARDEPTGVYGFLIFAEQAWTYVIVDDFLYVNPEKRALGKRLGCKGLYFSGSSYQNETWVSLLEKMFAKFYGGYQALEGGHGGRALENLTGGVNVYRAFRLYDDQPAFRQVFHSALWNMLLTMTRGTDCRFLFVGSTPLGKAFEIGSQGLSREDSYCILGATEIHRRNTSKSRQLNSSEVVRLVNIRDPEGRKISTDAWKGAYSDKSPQMTDRLARALGHERKNSNGLFWMLFSDFVSLFGLLDRTRITDRWHSFAQISARVPLPEAEQTEIDYVPTKFLVTVSSASRLIFETFLPDDPYNKSQRLNWVTTCFDVFFDGESNLANSACIESGCPCTAEYDTVKPGTYVIQVRLSKGAGRTFAYAWNSKPRQVLFQGTGNQEVEDVSLTGRASWGPGDGIWQEGYNGLLARPRKNVPAHLGKRHLEGEVEFDHNEPKFRRPLPRAVKKMRLDQGKGVQGDGAAQAEQDTGEADRARTICLRVRAANSDVRLEMYE